MGSEQLNVNCSTPGAPGHPPARKHLCKHPMLCEICNQPAAYGVTKKGEMKWYCSDHWRHYDLAGQNG